MRIWLKLALLCGLLLPLSPVHAVEPSEMLRDPAQEARARELSAQLRCLVCQNESIDDSHADLARDLRVLIREKISKGDSNADIKTFLVARYGDFILLQPPFKSETLLLWLSPPLLLLLGAAMVYRAARRTRPAAPALTEEEERRLAKIAQDAANEQ
jgi:cytochrome c-type biogenesis protein CcmH